MTLLALVPLFMTLFLALAVSLHYLKRKSLAQALCVLQASRLQENLKPTLTRLIRLNPEAQSLRIQREKANQALISANISANPYAIAAAQAYWNSVVLQQMRLKTQQQMLLYEAERARSEAHRQLRADLRGMEVLRFQSQRFHWRPLAVEARPIESLTPDYHLTSDFEKHQQHRFEFVIDLQPLWFSKISLFQQTNCSATLTGKEYQWENQVLEASVFLKRFWL